MVKKPSAPSTPQQTKSTFKIQSEQRQNAKQNKNKRKSLPANLVNSNGSSSPKKPKVEPFSGTSDLFMQMKQKPEVKSEKIKVENKKPLQQDSDSNPNLGSRAKRRRDRLRARRVAGKQKLKQTLVDAATGNESAVAHLKERVSELQNKDVLSSAASRKLKKLRKVLRDAGITLPSKPETKNKQNLSKASNKTTQKGKKIKTEAVDDKKIIKQEKKQQTKREVKVKKEELESDEEEDGTQLQKQSIKQEISKQQIKKEEPESDAEDDSEDDEEEEETDDSILDAESMEVEGEEDDSDEIEEEEGDSDETDEEDEEEDDSEDDADSDENEDGKQETQKGKPGKQPQTKKFENQPNNVSSLEKSKSRYVLFVGNLPFDITKEEISQHFAKIGNVKDIRIPLDKQTNKCRGFAYVELLNQAGYEKALSLHHTTVKGRRINVLYTQGGKKKGEEKKQEIKAKNLKLQAMRQEGKLVGSVKQSQKRAARRDKKRKAGKAT